MFSSSRESYFTKEDRRQIVCCEESLINAIRTSDIERLDQLLHEGLLFIDPTGYTVTKAIDMETYRSGNISISAIEASGQEISIIGDTAVVTVTKQLTGTYLNVPLQGRYRYTRVWKNFNGSWQVIAGSCVQIAPPL